MTNYERLILEASKVWCPDLSPEYPRRVSNANTFQTEVTSRYRLVSSLIDAQQNGKDGFVSTYSFPRGHTDAGDNVPEINTIFVDFDIPADSEYRQSDHSLNAWKRSMSDLLIRVQMVASTLLESGKAKHWRASLSGHKGVHLFFDFEPVHEANGSYKQFKTGLKQYGDKMIEQIDEFAGGINIQPWVDVDSSDLARLVRHPNTRHPGAKHRDESWCVPVTIQELADMTADDYLKLTNGPREIPDSCQRNPSAEGRDEIGLKIRNVNGGGSGSRDYTETKMRDPKALQDYRERSNDDINVGTIPLLVQNKPCIMAFAERDDSYKHGAASRTMEINVMKELIQKEVPVDTIVNFFRGFDGFNESDTRTLVEDLIARYDGPFTCKNIWNDGGEFCVAMNDDYDQSCRIYDKEQMTS
jgi:hypothetical protein